MNNQQYFNPDESQELAAAGVSFDKAWKVVDDFVLGQGYVRQAPQLIDLAEIPPRHERYRNVSYYPAVELPE